MTRDYQHAIKTLEGNKTRNDMNMIEVMDRVLEKWVMDFEVVWRSELKEFFDKVLPYLAHSPWPSLTQERLVDSAVAPEIFEECT